jgi:sugar phosphate isomerase/epimerase
MWNWDREKIEALPAACSHEDDILAHVEAVNDEYLVACVDVGHASMRGLNTNPYNMIKKLGSHVAALHLHDNDLHRDKHAIPFTMGVNFENVARALAEIDYRGDMTLEVLECYEGVADADLPCVLDKMAAAALRIGEMTEGYKAKLGKQ